MGKIKEYGMFALKIIIVLAVVKFVKKWLPAPVQEYLP